MNQPDRIPARLDDRYDLGRVIGRGGMATVYEAHDRRLDRQVAVKVVDLAGTDPSTRERFVHEAHAAAKIHHRGVVEVFDAGQSDELLFIAMELVDGHSVAAEIGRRGPLQPARAAAVAAGVLDALDVTHAAGIVHRDVKPSNVMLADDGDVKLLDFGIAAQLDAAAGLTATGTVIGTAAYLSPERVTGQPASPRSDLYAVGVLLYEMLTGEPPFHGDSPIAVASAHVHAPVPDVRARNADVPAELAAVVDRALAKQPDERYPDAATMRAALTAGTHEPTAAYPQLGPPDLATSLLVAPDEPNRATAWPIALIGAFALIVLLAIGIVSNGSPLEPVVDAAPPTTAAPAAAAIATTVPAPPPTTVPPPTVAAPAPPAPPPATVDELIAVISADPGRYGPAAGELIDRLDGIGRGRKARDRAADLRQQVDAWVASGELTPEAGDLTRPVLDAAGAAGNSDEDDD